MIIIFYETDSVAAWMYSKILQQLANMHENIHEIMHVWQLLQYLNFEGKFFHLSPVPTICYLRFTKTKSSGYDYVSCIFFDNALCVNQQLLDADWYFSY